MQSMTGRLTLCYKWLQTLDAFVSHPEIHTLLNLVLLVNIKYHYLTLVVMLIFFHHLALTLGGIVNVVQVGKQVFMPAAGPKDLL